MSHSDIEKFKESRVSREAKIIYWAAELEVRGLDPDRVEIFKKDMQ